MQALTAVSCIKRPVSLTRTQSPGHLGHSHVRTPQAGSRRRAFLCHPKVAVPCADLYGTAREGCFSDCGRSQSALAAELPSRKAGLWELNTNIGNRSGPGVKAGQYIDASTDQLMQSSAGPLAQAACFRRDTKKSGNTVVAALNVPTSLTPGTAGKPGKTAVSRSLKLKIGGAMTGGRRPPHHGSRVRHRRVGRGDQTGAIAFAQLLVVVETVIP